jgi:hypothetical protein
LLCKRKVRFSKKFEESIDEIKRKDSSWVERIKETTRKIIEDPKAFDKSLSGKISYKVEKYVAKNGYRIEYRFCSYCIANKQKNIETCEDCGKVLKNSSEGIWFFDIFRKNLANTQKKGNKIY